ncbi:MAG TPA: hypothetical protein VLL54_20625 [Pyrinomonadaceae bacterium]|nr:hypothetical protein [Pyrinomonadaceae bacterium]
MASPTIFNDLDGEPGIQRPKLEVSLALSQTLLEAAKRLPHYDNHEFYSTELQSFVAERIRQSCPEEFDGLVTSIKTQVSGWPYWVVVRGLQFDEGNRLFVGLNRAFGQLLAPPYQKPRAQLIHYIQPSTDLKSARGGHESERLHTDTADWRPPVELISMVCVRPDRQNGGRSRILDVDSIRDEVKNQLGAETLKLLEDEPVPWLLADYSGGGIDWRPVLSKTNICWRRYTIELALQSGGIRLSQVMQSALNAFEDVIANTSRTADFLMKEQELLFSNNRRTIHARTPVSGGDLSDRLMLRSWIRTS